MLVDDRGLITYGAVERRKRLRRLDALLARLDAGGIVGEAEAAEALERLAAAKRRQGALVLTVISRPMPDFATGPVWPRTKPRSRATAARAWVGAGAL